MHLKPTIIFSKCFRVIQEGVNCWRLCCATRSYGHYTMKHIG